MVPELKMMVLEDAMAVSGLLFIDFFSSVGLLTN